MKGRGAFVVLVLASLGAPACTNKHAVRETPRSLTGETAHLELVDGSSVTARAEPTPAGVVWRTRAGTAIASERIHTIAIRKPGGAARGAVVGIGVGGLLGWAAGMASGDDPHDPDAPEGVRIGRSMEAAAAAMLLGFAGGLMGALVGSRSSWDEYQLPGPSKAHARPATPTQLRLRQRCAKETANWRRAEGDDRVRLWGEMSLDCQRLVSGLL